MQSTVAMAWIAYRTPPVVFFPGIQLVSCACYYICTEGLAATPPGGLPPAGELVDVPVYLFEDFIKYYD